MSATPLFTILAANKHNDTTLMRWLAPFSFGLMCAFIKWEEKHTHTQWIENNTERFFFCPKIPLWLFSDLGANRQDCERDICAYFFYYSLCLSASFKPIMMHLARQKHHDTLNLPLTSVVHRVDAILYSVNKATVLCSVYKSRDQTKMQHACFSFNPIDILYPTVKLIMRSMHVRFVVPDCRMSVSFIPIIGTWTEF